MNAAEIETNRRILIIDDNPAIHEDFRKMLSCQTLGDRDFEASKAFLFNEPQPGDSHTRYLIDSAYHGEEGYAMVRRSAELRTFYAMAFVDLRMPPGWDGIETIMRMWEICPELEVVICTAYSDYSWEYINKALGRQENLLVLMKPCDKIEVLQIADSFTRRWQSGQQAQIRLTELQQLIQRQHQELELAYRRLAEVNGSMQGDREDKVKLASAVEIAGRRASVSFLGFMQVRASLHNLLREASRLSQFPLSPDQKEQAKCILENGRRLFQLIERVPAETSNYR